MQTKFLSNAFIISVILLFGSCQSMEKGTTDKEKMTKNMISLKEKIDKSIDNLDDKIKDSKGLQQKILKKAKSSLNGKSDELKKAIKKLESSSEEDFEKLKKEMESLAQKAESGLSDLFKEVKKSIEK